jgi:hypothetical protein
MRCSGSRLEVQASTSDRAYFDGRHVLKIKSYTTSLSIGIEGNFTSQEK